MMMATGNRSRWLGCLVLSALLSATTAAMPQAPGSEARAQQLANDGSKELAQNNPRRAIELFTEADRPFCLYAVIGSHRQAVPLTRQLNEVLDRIEVA